ncbi:hypothetical protein [Kiloniella sp. b19]|uniref:hypothetical protein n=1 Tax=Kiloniella sp. GXU_MW_B19 TaxID=3141326 RepID=UPI0031CE85D7
MSHVSAGYVKTSLALLALLALSACASPAQQQAMIPDVTEETLIDDSSRLAQAVELGEVSGGEDTNPLWTSEVGTAEFEGALRDALASHALLANENGRYELVVTLTKLDQPLIGFDMTVTSKVRYVLTDIREQKVVFDESIDHSFTATVGDAFVAVQRLRLANEGSIRENIRHFLVELIKRDRTPEQLSSLDNISIRSIKINS